MNGNKAIALEIVKLHGGFKNPKKTAEKYNEVLMALNNKDCGDVSEQKNEVTELEKLTIPKGTIIHLRGIPFELPEDTKALGLQNNLDLALREVTCVGISANYNNALINHASKSEDKSFQEPS